MSNRIKPAILSILLTLPLAAQALDRLELLPPDAQTYLRVSNVTNFWSGLKESPIGKLWTDPQFQDFMGNPDAETWAELFSDGDSDAEDAITLEQFKMLKGEVIFAFDREMEDLSIISAMDEADFLRSLELDEKLNDVLDEPIEMIKSHFQGVEIIRYIEDGDEEDSTWQAFVDGTFIMGHSQEWVERCIVRLQKEQIEEPQGNPTFNLNLPLKHLIDNWVEEMDGHGAATSTRNLVDALGLGGLENLSMTAELKKDEMTIDSHLKVSDLTRGLFALLDFQPSEIPNASFIPGTITSFESGRINLFNLWKEIPEILGAISPDAATQLDMVVGLFMQQTGVDFEQDLLGNLGTQYFTYSLTKIGQEPTTVVALELKDSLAFKTALESLLAAPSLQAQLANILEIEEFLDHTVYNIKAADPTESKALCIVGDYLIYSPPEGLRQVIRSLVSDGDIGDFERSSLIQGLRKHKPARAFSFGATDWKKNIVALIHELNQPEYTVALTQGWIESEVPIPPPDFNKLPSAEHIASFFNVAYQYAEATGDGIQQQTILKY